jgi:DNA-directed RNA polymerase subunit F
VNASASPVATVDATANSKYVRDASKFAPEKLVARKRSSQGNNNAEDWEEGWMITSEMKTRIQTNEWLRTELRDCGLRHLLVQIYEAPNVVSKNKRNHGADAQTEQEQVLEKIKEENPQFKSFLDKLSLVAGVLEYSGPAKINDLLPRDLDEIREHLTLVPDKKRSSTNAIADRIDDLTDDGEDSTTSGDNDSSSAASTSADSDSE